MPSPTGHALGGMIGGWSAGGRAPWPQWASQALVFSAIGMLPDIDLLLGAHSGPTHSIGAALVVAVLAWGVSGFRARPAMIIAIFLAYASHILLDWLGDDTSAPYGVMAFWPMSHEYLMSPIPLFPAITRRYWLEGFWLQNFRALVFELVVLGPLVVGVWWARGYRRPR